MSCNKIGYNIRNSHLKILVAEIKKRFGYKFNDPFLLQQAFTHVSYYNQNSQGKNICGTYERLEYVGDAFFTFVVAKDHFSLYPGMNPGQLTNLRSANVNNNKLARAGANHKLYKFLLHNIGGLSKKIKIFEKELQKNQGHIVAPKVLADIVESLIGAVLVDSNSIDTTWQIARKVMEPAITSCDIQPQPVTKLNNYFKKHKQVVKSGIDKKWNVTGEVKILLGKEIAGKVKHPNKTTAKNKAAHQTSLIAAASNPIKKKKKRKRKKKQEKPVVACG